MKKLLIATAAMAVVAGAQAQSSVTAYGILDLNYTSVDSKAANSGKATAQGKDSLGTSRLGFKGTEDLGAGLKAEFQLEGTLDATNGRLGKSAGATYADAAPTTFDREGWVGLSSATLGSVRFGRTDVTSAQAIDNGVSRAADLGKTAGDLGVDKAQTARYTSPTISGFTLQVGVSNGGATTDYTTDATSSATGSGTVTSVYGQYEAGALGLYAGQTEAKTTATYDRKDTVYGAKYDFGFADVGIVQRTIDAMGIASTTDGAYGKLKQTVYSVSAPVSVLGGGVKAHAIYHVTNSDNGDRFSTATSASATDIAISDSKKTTVALTKAFSKRTTGYAAYIKTNFDKAGEADNTAYAVGINHSF